MKLKTTLLLALFSTAIFAQFSCQDLKKVAGINQQSINNNAKSDTIDILHYHIAMDATDIVNQNLSFATTVTFVPKMAGVQFMELDLLKLQIDSVTPTSLVSSYNYNDTLLGLHFSSALSVTDTNDITIYYHGKPQGDATGWGGFHFAAPYYFNLGVGFGADPHTYGRAWFPCFDNFVEKSTYSFDIKTEGGRKAYCNGLRTSITSLAGDTIISHWSLSNPIPTYLASVAISNYEELAYSHGGVPYMLMARAADTIKLKNSFVNITQTHDAYEDFFGPYFWDKMGYVLTTVGAMEHATSIHYPRNLANGNLSGEDIMAHEMAHHWWGNLITCATAEDMWINEGMAEFSSHLYEEKVYNKAKYLETVRNNGAFVIQYAAVQDNGHHAIYGVSHDLTYGTHVYQKGAMVGHNLRGYLGDSLFFAGTTKLLEKNKYGNLNSFQFRDSLSAITGYSLTSFFDDWIFQPGYPEFNIDSLIVFKSSLPEKSVVIGISQRQRAATHAFTNIPLEITYFDETGNSITKPVVYANADLSFTTQMPFTPTYAVINYNSHILTGTTANEETITTTGNLDLKRALMTVDVISVNTSATLRVEHHWAGPGGLNPKNFKISSSRYWRVTGILPNGFSAEARMNYSKFPNQGGLDADLLGFSEDSLILLYRVDSRQPWLEYPYYQKNILNNPNNGFGRMELSKLMVGEYVFANGVSTIGLDENLKENKKIKVYPNPADSVIRFHIPRKLKNESFKVYNSNGTVVLEGVLEPNNSGDFTISTIELATGNYVLLVDGKVNSFVVAR